MTKTSMASAAKSSSIRNWSFANPRAKYGTFFFCAISWNDAHWPHLALSSAQRRLMRHVAPHSTVNRRRITPANLGQTNGRTGIQTCDEERKEIQHEKSQFLAEFQAA